MSSTTSMNKFLSKKTTLFSLRIWVIIGIAVGASIVSILCLLYIYAAFRKKSRSSTKNKPNFQTPKELRVDRIGVQKVKDELILTVPDKMAANLGTKKSSEADTISQCSSMYRIGCSSQSGEDGSSGRSRIISSSPMEGLPEISHLGWGHWFTLRDLEVATNRFSVENVIGEGGYGVVYRGKLINGVEVAVKKLINNLGQAEREFRVEVEAIGHVRHKNLVKLLGYCIEGVHRILVYEYVNNGNLEQWLHLRRGALSWEDRMKIILGTSKALAYLHEAIEPKLIHRDIKSSNILIDNDFNPKVSDFGLAKLLDSGESHVTTRVMGTFGYVAPEYANTGMLNEKSDVYSFGILLLETITGRDPVDYSRKDSEVNLVEWIKLMIASKRAEEVVDHNLERKPAIRCLKTVLLVAVRCIDSDSTKRPKMSQVVRTLEADEHPFSEMKNRKSRTTVEIESKTDDNGGIEPSAE